MKKAIFTILSLVAIGASAQNWMPFHEGQKSYYSYTDEENDIRVDDFKIIERLDSDNGVSTFKFHEIANYEGELTQENPHQSYDSYSYDYNNIFIDATQHHDSIFFKHYDLINHEYINGLFLPESGINESWTTNGYTVTCQSIIEEEFMGITDSVKIFTYTNDADETGEIKLSKNHGFINFKWLIDNDNQYQLIGLHDNLVSVGFNAPQFEDIFTYQAGDVRNLRFHIEEHDETNPVYDYVVRDSIIATSSDDNSTSYTIHRWKKELGESTESEFTEHHTHSMEGAYINSELNWFEVVNDEDSGYQSLFLNAPLILEIEDNDTIVLFEIQENLCDLTSGIELYIDAYQQRNYKTGLGETYRGTTSDGGTNKITLIGGVISNEQWGEQISVGIDEDIKRKCNIYPNPSSDAIIIEGMDQSIDYKIISISGQTVNTGQNDKEINISQLECGTYILEIHSAGKIYNQQFVKK